MLCIFFSNYFAWITITIFINILLIIYFLSLSIKYSSFIGTFSVEIIPGLLNPNAKYTITSVKTIVIVIKIQDNDNFFIITLIHEIPANKITKKPNKKHNQSGPKHKYG